MSRRERSVRVFLLPPPSSPFPSPRAHTHRASSGRSRNRMPGGARRGAQAREVPPHEKRKRAAGPDGNVATRMPRRFFSVWRACRLSRRTWSEGARVGERVSRESAS